jgi:hypothetical protein
MKSNAENQFMRCPTGQMFHNIRWRAKNFIKTSFAMRIVVKNFPLTYFKCFSANDGIIRKIYSRILPVAWERSQGEANFIHNIFAGIKIYAFSIYKFTIPTKVYIIEKALFPNYSLYNILTKISDPPTLTGNSIPSISGIAGTFK